MDNNPDNIPGGITKIAKQDLRDIMKRLDNLEFRIEKSESENVEIIDRNIDLSSEIDELKEADKKRLIEIKHKDKKIQALEKKIRKLEDKIHRKNSRNSSLPPSQDQNRKKTNQSLRKKSGLKPGGQKGHKGSTLEMSSTPTQIIDHYPERCEHCNSELTNFKLARKRQVFELPEFKIEILEHRTYKGKCTCGCITVSNFPKGVKAPVSYGPKTEAMIAYLSVRQFIPVKRIEEMFRQVFGLKISASTIKNKLGKCSDKMLHYYAMIQDLIKESRVVGSDETTCRMNGGKGWIWTWQTEDLTYLRFSNNRSLSTIHSVFPKGLPNSILVHDCLQQQFSIKCKGHQMCIAHLLRELNYFIEMGSKWSGRFKNKLLDALKLLDRIKINPKKNYRYQIRKLNKEIDILLRNNRNAKGKLKAFVKRLKKHRESLLRFLEDPQIPPDNNGSERALRNVKVKTKVSGMFKTEIGADEFVIIRSVIDTFLKRDQPVMQSLLNILS